MITERLMGAGRWEFDLDPETPRSVRSLLDPEDAGFWQLVVTDVPVDVDGLADADILGLARYSGLYRSLDGLTLSGASLAALLEDEDGKGDIHGSPGVSYTSATLQDVIDDEAARVGLWAATAESLSGYTSGTQILVTPLEVIEAACSALGAEWRVRPDMEVKAGTAAFLYGSTPDLIILADDEGGHELDLVGVRGMSRQSVDVEDYATLLIYVTDTETPTYTVASLSPSTDYTRPDGTKFKMAGMVTASVNDGSASTLAAAELGKKKLRRGWDVSTEADITVPVGAPVWLWSPDDGLIDTTTQVYFRGRTLFPTESRLMGKTWPIRPGMGVYLRHKDGTADATYLDLSSYYVPESGATQLEVGATPRPSS